MSPEQQEGSNGSMLESRVAVLEELFVRLAQAGAAESILGPEFERVSARLESISERLKNIANQFAPFRALGPEPPDWEPHQKTLMDNLVTALVPPQPGDAKQPPHAEKGPI